MHFSEDDLREALKRKDPGEGFTQRVMARVNQSQAEGTKKTVTKKTYGTFWAWWKLRPAWERIYSESDYTVFQKYEWNELAARFFAEMRKREF